MGDEKVIRSSSGVLGLGFKGELEWLVWGSLFFRFFVDTTLRFIFISFVKCSLDVLYKTFMCALISSAPCKTDNFSHKYTETTPSFVIMSFFSSMRKGTG